jgi:hypothetical protein
MIAVVLHAAAGEGFVAAGGEQAAEGVDVFAEIAKRLAGQIARPAEDRESREAAENAEHNEVHEDQADRPFHQHLETGGHAGDGIVFQHFAGGTVCFEEQNVPPRRT